MWTCPSNVVNVTKFWFNFFFGFGFGLARKKEISENVWIIRTCSHKSVHILSWCHSCFTVDVNMPFRCSEHDRILTVVFSFGSVFSAAQMANITRDFRLGYGAFIDKTVMPYIDIHPNKWVLKEKKTLNLKCYCVNCKFMLVGQL